MRTSWLHTVNFLFVFNRESFSHATKNWLVNARIATSLFVVDHSWLNVSVYEVWNLVVLLRCQSTWQSCWCDSGLIVDVDALLTWWEFSSLHGPKLAASKLRFYVGVLLKKLLLFVGTKWVSAEASVRVFKTGLDLLWLILPLIGSFFRLWPIVGLSVALSRVNFTCERPLHHVDCRNVMLTVSWLLWESSFWVRITSW